MANITTSGSTSYPGSLDTRTILTDGPAGDEIVANHPNGLSAAVLAIETELGVDPAGTLPDLVTRLAVHQNTDGTLKSTVVAAGTGATVDYSAGVFTVGSTPDGPGNTQNVGLIINLGSPVSNAFTARLVQRTLSTCTSASPARISFRSGTATTGDYAIVTATDNVSLTASVGSTFGFTSAEKGRIYFYAINANPGAANSVIELAIARKAIFDESQLYSTTAEGGAGAADSDTVLYSSSARANVPVRCIGFMDITTGATAGNWSNSPTVLHLMGPGTKRTGDVVQRFATYTYAQLTGTTQTPWDATPPLIGEGNPVLAVGFAATSTLNPVRIHTSGLYYAPAGGGERITAHLHIGAGSAIAATSMYADTASNKTVPLDYTFATGTGTIASQTYSLRAGSSAAGTFRVNGEGGAGQLYTTAFTWMEITEFMA